MMVGKWHNTPGPLSLPSSVKDSWPTQRGFEHFYGFMEGETNFFFPARLMLGNDLLPIDEYQRGYYSTDDWIEKAIGFVRDHRAASPDKPFFLYVANNAVHAPFQAKAKDIAKYRGAYDQGWTRVREARYRRQLELGLIPPGTRLAPSDPVVPPWDETDPADRPLFARHMETYAAMLDCADQNLGRLVAYLEALGERDNTIVVFSSDNGGTHAGGPIGSTYNNRRMSGLPEDPIARERERLDLIGTPRSNALYPTGWGQVSNTPFPTYKTYTGGGGRRVSFVISWPARIADGGAIRSQFVHVTDVMPTLLDLAGVAPLTQVNGRPAREPHGRSFAAVLFDAAAASLRREQYYECWSNRGYYRDGWLARSLQKRGEPIDLDNWTLHDLSRDFSESEDVRDRHPERLRELVAAFDDAAWTNLVYPLDNRTMVQKMSDGAVRPGGTAPAARAFAPGTQTARPVRLSALFPEEAVDSRAPPGDGCKSCVTVPPPATEAPRVDASGVRRDPVTRRYVLAFFTWEPSHADNRKTSDSPALRLSDDLLLRRLPGAEDGCLSPRSPGSPGHDRRPPRVPDHAGKVFRMPSGADGRSRPCRLRRERRER